MDDRAMRFRDLAIGQTFDFIDPQAGTKNSFFHRCRKISNRSYRTAEDAGAPIMRIGTVACRVFNVEG